MFVNELQSNSHLKANVKKIPYRYTQVLQVLQSWLKIEEWLVKRGMRSNSLPFDFLEVQALWLVTSNTIPVQIVVIFTCANNNHYRWCWNIYLQCSFELNGSAKILHPLDCSPRHKNPLFDKLLLIIEKYEFT